MADLNLSARAYDRILKVARTIAEFGGREKNCQRHVSERFNTARSTASCGRKRSFPFCQFWTPFAVAVEMKSLRRLPRHGCDGFHFINGSSTSSPDLRPSRFSKIFPCDGTSHLGYA